MMVILCMQIMAWSAEQPLLNAQSTAEEVEAAQKQGERLLLYFVAQEQVRKGGNVHLCTDRLQALVKSRLGVEDVQQWKVIISKHKGKRLSSVYTMLEKAS